MDHKGRGQDQGWHQGGKVKGMPFCEGSGPQALHLWDRNETRGEGWHCCCYLPLEEEKGEAAKADIKGGVKEQWRVKVVGVKVWYL